MISEFMGDGSMFNLKAKAWSTYQKSGESAREWAARITLLLTYNGRKELIDSKKYANNLQKLDFADANFKDRNSLFFMLNQYDWMSIKYYDSMIRYFINADQSPPWRSAMNENYKDINQLGQDEERMAMSEGGGDTQWDVVSTNPPTKQIYENIPWFHTKKTWGPTLEDPEGWTVHNVPLNNYELQCDGKHDQDENHVILPTGNKLLVTERPMATTEADQMRMFLEVDGKELELDKRARRVFNRGALAGLAIEKYRAMTHEILTIYIRNSLPEIRAHLVQSMDSIFTLGEAVFMAEKIAISKDLTGRANINLLQGEDEEEDRNNLDSLKEEIAAIRQQIKSSSKKQIAAVFQRNPRGDRGGKKGGWSSRGGSNFGRRSSQVNPKSRDQRRSNRVVVRNVPVRPVLNGADEEDEQKCHNCGSSEHFYRECPKPLRRGLRAPGAPAPLGRSGHPASRQLRGDQRKRYTRYVRVIDPKPVAAATEEFEIDEDMFQEINSTTEYTSDSQQTEDEEEEETPIGALSLGENNESEKEEDTHQPLLF